MIMKLKIAFIVLMCFASIGFSQVVYTNLEDKPAVVGNDYTLNFMGGAVEFAFENYTLHGSSIEMLCLTEGAQVIVSPLDSISDSSVDLLTEGMNIGSSESFSTNKGRKNFVIYYDGVYTDWVGQCGYIGFRFKNGSDIHYGWAKIAVEVSDDAVLKLYGYAYQSQPNTAIKAGDTVMNCGGIPFKDSCEWSVSCHKYRTLGDTVVNGKTYLTVYKDEFWNPETGTGRTISYALIRYDMDTRCLYGIPANSTQPLNSLSESLLYDFSMQVGDSVTITSFDRYHDLVAKCVGRDSVTLRNGEKRAALRIRIINPKDQWGEPDGYDETIWIEGIGSNYGLFSPDCKDEYDCVYEILRLLCYHEQGELLLDFPEFDRDSLPGDCYNSQTGMRVPHVTAAQFLSVCPNPARDQVVVKVSDPAALNGELSLTNMLGEVVYRGFIKNSETTLSLQGLANGMYIAVYRSAKGVQQFRFMKE